MNPSDDMLGRLCTDPSITCAEHLTLLHSYILDTCAAACLDSDVLPPVPSYRYRPQPATPSLEGASLSFGTIRIVDNKFACYRIIVVPASGLRWEVRFGCRCPRIILPPPRRVDVLTAHGVRLKQQGSPKIGISRRVEATHGPSLFSTWWSRRPEKCQKGKREIDAFPEESGFELTHEHSFAL